MKPYFSVVIPLYNKENYIEKTLHSVLNQAFQDFEVIVVNDGSTDKSPEKVRAFKDSRIRLISIENSGVSHARNTGILEAKADFIAFLDADDLWEKNHLKDLLQLIQNFPNCGLYATAYVKKSGERFLECKFKDIPKGFEWSGIVQNYFESSIYNSIAWASAVAIPKNTFETIGLFDDTITLGAGEDTDMWIRIALKHPIAFSNKVSAIHNLHAENRLSNTNTNLRHFINLDNYESIAKSNPSLKRYLDINRFSIGLKYILSSNKEKGRSYFEKIDKQNLNWKQRVLVNQPKEVLIFLVIVQNVLRKMKIQLTAFH
ncbi:MAG TPA: glycosyltransferase family 2 protein [Flavobacteriaceae bacterium]|nr:glycosyltransferase family 2 protein [Flavobacteriaceae bacterium]